MVSSFIIIMLVFYVMLCYVILSLIIQYRVGQYRLVSMIDRQTLAISLAVAALVGVLVLISPSEPGCVTRSTMIARGQDWVDKHVPYNHEGTHDGYRTDCSGFVSMCWELAKPGLFTYTIQPVVHNITKDSLTAGDALLCDSHHIVLFAGWSDSSRSHYIAMEQIDPAHGTLKRVNPYPYYSNTTCFHPIRFNSVC